MARVWLVVLVAFIFEAFPLFSRDGAMYVRREIAAVNENRGYTKRAVLMACGFTSFRSQGGVCMLEYWLVLKIFGLARELGRS